MPVTRKDAVVADYDVIIIGSGFGGSVTALRLAEKGYRVGVLEAGRRFGRNDYGKTSWRLRRFFWFPRIGLRGILRMTLLRDVFALTGVGVGGGSLVWANTSYEPHETFYTDPQWGDITDWKAELAPFYDQARRMLGVETNPTETNSDRVIKDLAGHFGVEDSYRPTPVAVHFGERGVTVPDPYFGGAGPSRTGCIECGGCMVGCRHNAKNTLDHNYLYLAERLGTDVYPEHQVVDVVPRPEGGYEIHTERSGAWVRKRRRTFTATGVVFSAGALGTTRLLLELKERGRLPRISDRIGHQVRTNSEALVGAVAGNTEVDYSQGVAITSSIHPEPFTHIEPVRYSPGSNSMGLLGTILVDGGGPLQPLKFLLAAARHPITFLRSLSTYRWSERTVILLVMQSLDNSLRVFRRKGWFGARLTSEQSAGKPNPTFIPIANEAARTAAQIVKGMPMGSINDSMLDIPMTAHILGGAPVGATTTEGVTDPYHRVHGYPDLHVIDGAAVGANLGVNPSLSIAALAERAVAMWPNKGDDDPRPGQHEPYRTVPPVPPATPAVPPDAPAGLFYA
jgi:cholesterol oxidase